MNAPTIIALIFVVVLLGLAIFHLFRRNKSGKNSCGCGCSGCHSSACHPVKPDSKDINKK